MIYVLGPRMSLEEIAGRIGEMRDYVRGFDINVRSNTSTISTLVSIYRASLLTRCNVLTTEVFRCTRQWSWLNQQRKKVDPNSRPLWVEEVPETGSSRKRARPDHDDDYVGGGIRSDGPSDRRNTRFQG